MKSNWLRFAAVPALAAGMMFAQTSGSTNPPQDRAAQRQQFQQKRLDRLATVLSLTEAQKEQAQTIFTQSQQSATALNQQLKQNRDAMKAAVKSDNASQIQQLAAEQGKLLGQVIAIHSNAMAEFYKILTPEQQTKAEQLHQQFQGRMHHGFGPRG